MCLVLGSNWVGTGSTQLDPCLVRGFIWVEFNLEGNIPTRCGSESFLQNQRTTPTHFPPAPSRASRVSRRSPLNPYPHPHPHPPTHTPTGSRESRLPSLAGGGGAPPPWRRSSASLLVLPAPSPPRYCAMTLAPSPSHFSWLRLPLPS